MAAKQRVCGAGEAIDITKAVVDAYNVQSGVPAPAAATGAAKPAAPKPSSEHRQLPSPRAASRLSPNSKRRTPLVSEKFQQAA